MVIKSNTLNNKHISSIIKTRVGSSIKSISFNSFNTHLGEYLLSHKNKINIIAEINENFWNNKKTIQLNIKDILI